ncbi:MAG: polyamine aminopropyltransferase [Deltaproteobacteria bacterium]|nr:polyamine aminopropyltransferase [Deltaproteobacteria bacterium]MBW2041015.1 polyamine aminopropyltransferase [Deltaproteobacteria bacterium]MBW2131320.1 polyamine aminopropyltransferase [Deltaproteobacteria bacterium]
MTGLGTHILLDFYGCDPRRLDDLGFLKKTALEGVRRSGATIITDHFKQFTPQGVSGVVIIAESHLTLHTWPEFSYIAVDYFTCGDTIDIDAAIDHFSARLHPDTIEISRNTRGKRLGKLPSEALIGKAFQPIRGWETESAGNGGSPDKRLLEYRYAVDQVLLKTRSRFQEIQVIENPVFGRMLWLDQAVQTAEKDEFVYHEMLGHVPAVIHGSPEDVLIIGGGDGGLLREVLKHESLKRIELVDIDAAVVDVSRRYLPFTHRAFEDPRVHLFFDDGMRFVTDKTRAYDLILVDSTDPVGPGEHLYQPAFYEACKAALKEGGLFTAQALSVWLQEKEQAAMFQNMAKVFERIAPYLATVPTYPGALWAFAIGSDRFFSPDAFDRSYARDLSGVCRYYNPMIHESAFCLPNFMIERLEKQLPLRH